MSHALLASALLALALPTQEPSQSLVTPSFELGRRPLAVAPDVAGETVTVRADELELNAGSLSLADFDLGLFAPSVGGATPLASPGVGGRAGPKLPLPQPLGREELVLNELAEVALFSPSYGSPAGAAWIREDFRVGQGYVPGTVFDSSALGQIRDAAVGNIDDDPEEELVLLQQLAGATVIRLMRVDRVAGGSYVWTLVTELAGGAFVPDDGRIALGDFDGDQRDEIAVVVSDLALGTSGQRSLLRVFDDPEQGGNEMLFVSQTTNHVALWPEVGDLDGDALDELVLVLEGNTTSAGALAVRTYHCGRGNSVFPSAQPQTDWVALHESGTTPVGCKLALGNFDDDAAEEVVYVAMMDASSPFTPDAPSSLRLRPFQYAAGVWSSSGPSFTYSSPSEGASLRGNAWDVVAVDRFARGRDEIAVLRGKSAGNLTLDFFEFNAGAWVSTLPTSIEIARAAQASSGLALAVGDGDGDGTEDLYFAALQGTSASRPLVYGNLRGSLGSVPTLYSIQNVALSGASHAPVLAPGDFDADGLRVRFTGQQNLSVSDPIPLVLLSAAPTKAGIAQNHGDSASSYSVGSGSGAAVGVSVGISASLSTGFEAEAFGGLIGVSAKATLEATFTKTQTNSSQTTFVQGFTGSADADVIVFQGTLFRSSEYEIVSAPGSPVNLVGTLFRIDVPLGSNTYKWTVDYYNPRVRSNYQLGSALLPHQVGAPETYRNASEVQALLASYVGWRHPVTATVGQGSGSNSLAIELATESTSEEQREAALSLEAEFTIGVGTYGFGLTLSGGAQYSVTTSLDTVYAGSVGDIAAADYPTWSYDFGLAVYQPGRLADFQNLPLGWEGASYPLTVVTFWTEPTGSGY